jgi:hypothetical protein
MKSDHNWLHCLGPDQYWLFVRGSHSSHLIEQCVRQLQPLSSRARRSRKQRRLEKTGYNFANAGSEFIAKVSYCFTVNVEKNHLFHNSLQCNIACCMLVFDNRNRNCSLV